MISLFKNVGKRKSVCLGFLLCQFTLFFEAQAVEPIRKVSINQKEERYKSLETFARALYLLETMYVDESKVSHSKSIHNALKGIVGELDPHTMILPKEAFERMTHDTRGKFGGVGIIVSGERQKLIVVSPIEDTPAHRAGIQSQDEIIEIDGNPVAEMGQAMAVERMRGEPGSELELVIKRQGEPKPLTFTLIREVIKIKSVRKKELAKNIMYVRISSFQEDTGEELRDILTKRAKNLKGLILDLRDNPGGLLNQSVRVADLFIDSGLLVSTVGRDRTKIEREFAHKSGSYINFPIIVLVNDGSASASEIVAGALQDHERALILGTQTFGKGSVQTLITLPDGSGLKVTIARYYTPKDRSIQAKGITPDIIVPSSTEITQSQRNKLKKEADLEGHISGKDLSNNGQKVGVLKSIRSWPLEMRRDNQLVTAFTYLKGWSKVN